MNSLPAHLRRHPNCDCGACCDSCGDHQPGCMSGLGSTAGTPEEVAQEDGYMHRQPHGGNSSTSY